VATKKKQSKFEKLKKFAKTVQTVVEDLKNFSFAKSSKLLQYLRLNDENNMVSITNIAVYLMLYKIYQTPAVSITDLTALAATILNYGHKKHLRTKENIALLEQ